VYYFGAVSTFSYSGRLVARQQLLATSLRLEIRAPLSAGNFCAPDLFLAKSGFGGLENIGRLLHPPLWHIRHAQRLYLGDDKFK
jgi:hypothetical protein